MKNGFDLSEARDMLGLAYAVNLLGPRGFLPQQVESWKKDFNNDINNPVKNDNGCLNPYPVNPIWPEGWTPGVQNSSGNPWNASVIVPVPGTAQLEALIRRYMPLLAPAAAKILARKFNLMRFGANNVVVTYNQVRNAYCIAFAGTQNKAGFYQDLSFHPVSAGPLDFSWYKSATTYMYNAPGRNVAEADHQVTGSVHMGFRMAVEQFTVNAAAGCSLVDVLVKLNKQTRGKDAQGRLRLFITGHSLGAAMGSLFTAWLQANQKTLRANNPGFPELVLKMYVWATPKTGNDPFINCFNAGLGNAGMAFHIDNSLDSIPQIPFTWEGPQSLNNPAMVIGMIPGMKKQGGATEEPQVQQDTSELGVDELALAADSIDTDAAVGRRLMGTIGKWIAREALEALKRSYDGKSEDAQWDDNNYGHPGQPVSLIGSFPLKHPDNTVPANYFPGQQHPDPVPFADFDTAFGSRIYGDDLSQTWWQHWPWVYRSALDETFAQQQ